jgi:hypothetical protein
VRQIFFWGFSFLAGGAGNILRPWTEAQRRFQSMAVRCSLRCLPIVHSPLIPSESQSYSRPLPAVCHQREDGRFFSAEPSAGRWPSTASPRNFVFWFSFLAVGAGTSLRPWTDGHRRYQRRGKGGKGYITPSHPSHALDTFCALPSMAIGWCLHRQLRRKT